MNPPESEYQILRLSDTFYKDYSNPPYIELLKKQKRAYNCLLFQTHYKYFICIPYRSEITHPYAFLFKKSKRSQNHKSGLDYSKIVIISNIDYLDTSMAIIDQDEFNETRKFIKQIKSEALKYVEQYIFHLKKISLLHPAEFSRRYTYSTLKYFHKELGI